MRSKNALHVFQCSVNSRRTQQVTAQRNELVSSTAVKKVRGWGPGVTATCARVVWEAIEALRPVSLPGPRNFPSVAVPLTGSIFFVPTGRNLESSLHARAQPREEGACEVAVARSAGLPVLFRFWKTWKLTL